MVLDWMNTSTSLTLLEWMKMERMHSVVFENKCIRRIEKDYPTPRGESVPKKTKIWLGLLCILLLILIFWSPMILFTIFTSVSKSTPPTEAKLSLTLNHYDSLFTYEFKRAEINNLSENEYQDLRADLKEKIPESRELFTRYGHEEVYSCSLDKEWRLAPVRLQEILLHQLQVNKELYLEVHWEFKRANGGTGEVSVVEGGKEILMDSSTQDRLAMAIEQKTSTYFYIPVNIIFQFTEEGHAVAYESSEGITKAAVSLKFDSDQSWWEIDGGCTVSAKQGVNESEKNCDYFKIYIFSGKRVPHTFSFISNKGVLGLYISVVFVIWTILRRFYLAMHSDILFYEMDNPDAVLQLCKDIYFARANQEFALEEDLYAKLIFLFKSPETMRKMTRLRQEDHV